MLRPAPKGMRSDPHRAQSWYTLREHMDWKARTGTQFINKKFPNFPFFLIVENIAGGLHEPE